MRLALCLILSLACDTATAQILGEGYTRGLLGVVTSGQPGDNGSGLGAGARVVEVTEGLPASEIGLQEGDIIMAVDKDIVRNSQDLQVAVGRREPKQEVRLTVQRGQELLEMTVRLANWNEWLLRTPGFGRFVSDVRFQPTSPELRDQLSIPRSVEGLAVLGISGESLYSRVLDRGMVILKINGHPIRDFADFMGHSRADINQLEVWENGRIGTIVMQGY